jgi:predicted ATPase
VFRSVIDYSPDISLGQLTTDKEVVALENLFDSVQGFEQRDDVGLVSGLSGGKARLVNAVLNMLVRSTTAR